MNIYSYMCQCDGCRARQETTREREEITRWAQYWGNPPRMDPITGGIARQTDPLTFSLQDVAKESLYRACKFNTCPHIDRVLYHNPATIVYWTDGTKTVVQCHDGDTYDREKGLLLCVAKRLYGNKGAYNDVLREWVVA